MSALGLSRYRLASVGALVAALTALGCSTEVDEPPPDTLITMAYSFEREFDPPAEALVLLRGYDINDPSEMATIINVERFDVTELPTDLALENPDDPHLLIEQGLVEVSAEDARFYFTIYVDVDGDGQICPGDFGQDWSRSQLSSFGVNLPDTLELFVAERDDGLGCIDPLSN